MIDASRARAQLGHASHASQSTVAPGRRAQTEPLAALVAVATICLALGLYAGSLAGTLPGNTERTTAEPVLESAWADVGTDSNYDPQAAPDPLESIPDDRLPRESTVTISVLMIDDGEPTLLAQATYVRGEHDPDAPTIEPVADASVFADTASRPIAVREFSGKISSATLHVGVHE